MVKCVGLRKLSRMPCCRSSTTFPAAMFKPSAMAGRTVASRYASVDLHTHVWQLTPPGLHPTMPISALPGQP